MPIHANDVETLHDFAVGVMARAGHHASQVRAIALAMLGGIIWRVEPGSIEIRFHEGNLANALRWTASPATNTPAPTFSNATPLTEVERIFSTL